MMSGFYTSRFSQVIVAFSLCLVSIQYQLDAIAPINNPYDPARFYSTRGTNPFPEAGPESRFMLDILPFYQHSAGSKPAKGTTFQCCLTPPPTTNNQSANDGTPSGEVGVADCCTQSCVPSCRPRKAPEGDRLGRWNMIGLLQGSIAAPNGALSPACQPVLYQAQQIIGCFPFFSQNYVDSSQTLGYFSVPINYQKIGLRAQGRIYLGYGLGLTACSGVARYKQVPCFIDESCNATAAALCPCDGEAPGTTPAQQFQQLPQDPVDCIEVQEVQRLLMTQEKLQQAMCEIGLSLAPVYSTSAEDTHFQLDWSGAFNLRNEDHVPVVTVLPYVAIGAWAPTGEVQHPDIAFSLPQGAYGFWGTTIEGVLNFDFPDTITIGGGLAATFYQSKDQWGVRMPSNLNQSTIYPWKTGIRRSPGVVWNAHIDFAAYDFIENLNFYFNYIYTKHERDQICLKCDNCAQPDPYCVPLNCSTCDLIDPYCVPHIIPCPTTPQQIFYPDKLEAESEWDSQVVNFGFDYMITRELTLGFVVQVPITGRRVYKTSTIMGSIRFNF